MSLDAAMVNSHLDRAPSSPLFRKAERQARFLRFVVDAALQSPEATIKEFDIAVAVYDRRADHDPRTDPIVRVEAARLRARLREYYEGTPPERVRIDIPKGQYVPQFIAVDGMPAAAFDDLSIMVAPFRSLSPDPGDQSFCDGLTEEVVHKLAREQRLRVITQSSAAWLEEKDRLKPLRGLGGAPGLIVVARLSLAPVKRRADGYQGIGAIPKYQPHTDTLGMLPRDRLDRLDGVLYDFAGTG